jgi:ABC-type nitrate/sulfonate/bicarbonate transport system permease component
VSSVETAVLPVRSRLTGAVLIARLRRSVLPTATAVALLAVWELASRTNLVPSNFVSPPTKIIVSLVDIVHTRNYWWNIRITLTGFAVGMFFGAIVAVPLGIFLGSSKFAFRSARALIEFVRPIPGFALLPLLILTLGLEFKLKVFAVAFVCFWPLLIQALYGVQDVDPVARDMAKAYGIGRTAMFFRIVLPSSLPYLATGTRLAAWHGLNTAVGIELLVSTTKGVGNEINQLGLAAHFSEMWAYVMTAAVLGLAISASLRRLEARALYWHSSQRRTVPL